jgi:RNA polymerase sigma factor (sigma-70 family)
VVQDVFERAMRQPHFFDDVRDPFLWLRRVMIHMAISRLRRRVVWEHVRRLVVPGETARDPDIAIALHRLPATQRAAIVLRYYLRENYAEIARTLGLSEASVGKTLSRARTTLREELR